uniref:Uncharacterized protein n=1 Tax=Manihot esculenta TaxID=3983 RepID=A0A2C9VMT2_MANES
MLIIPFNLFASRYKYFKDERPLRDDKMLLWKLFSVK